MVDYILCVVFDGVQELVGVVYVYLVGIGDKDQFVIGWYILFFDEEVVVLCVFQLYLGQFEIVIGVDGGVYLFCDQCG